MATTTNFGWETPDDTDLVKDGAAAIRTLGGAIDTSLVDLKGGTTGQVLSKASNTDMDFSWVSDATGIPATIFDAKGDIIAATAADTASRLAVGTNGQVLTADSTTSTGLKWATPASGGMTLLANGTITGTLNLTSISSDYKELKLYLWDYYKGTTGSTRIRLNNDSGANYYSARVEKNGTNAAAADGVSGATDIDLNAADIPANTGDNLAIITIPNYTVAAYKLAKFDSFVTAVGGTTWATINGTFGYKSTTAISQINILNMTAGSYELYGVK